MREWTPDSWHRRPAQQQPTYTDQVRLKEVLVRLAELPPLVTSWEVDRLKTQLAEAAVGQRFLLQGGCCAESFSQCRSDIITNKLKILLQMSLVLTFGLKRQIIRVGRFAGQYAKPRSADTETRDGVTLPTYRGELVNGLDFAPEVRRPDPERLLRGYEYSALTLNFIRSLVEGGFADLHHPEYWDLNFVAHSPRAKEYQAMVETISDSLRFMETLAGIQAEQISRVDFYTSHEGLHLAYEQANTRRVPHREGFFNLSTHMPWIGMRTADPGGAHVEYFRGISNPIGVKVGPGMTGEWLQDLLEILDPEKEPGRMTLIHRLGHDKVGEYLPNLIETVKESGHRVVWCCDPMHGNTETTASGLKTRRFENILSELEQSFDIHHAIGSYLGGVHFELSGDNVTECIGGARGLSEVDLERAYESHVDPRLNYEQSLEMALQVARKIATMNGRVV
ncbi:MAG: 3-deoxy-7-phosphoheptulonate synthase class II [Thermoanaerobaculales bacterium]|nr:3-deoxy-7-phosphoheptulonate synthase class II [Thermoanaerobaculales bacterium]